MQALDKFDISTVPIWKVIITVTSEPDYSMDRIYIVEDYPEMFDYTVIDGGHCSCFGFDETTWGAVAYTREEFGKLMQSWLTSGNQTEKIAARIWFETGRS